MSAAQPLPTNSTNSAGRKRRGVMRGELEDVMADGIGEPSAMASELLQVLADKLRHLEHVDGLLAAEHGLEGVVRVDHPLVLLVLQPVLLDVGPQLLRDFRARNRFRSHDLGQRGARLHRLHEGCVRFPLACCFLRHVISSVRGASSGSPLKKYMPNRALRTNSQRRNRQFSLWYPA